MIKWIFKMAWIESRFHRKKLFLYMSSIILGTSALVSIQSIGSNLENAVKAESKSLLGSDLRISKRSAFSQEADSLFDVIGGERASVTQFVSNIYIPKAERTRLVSIRAFESGFPFYGEIETLPKSAISEVFQDQNVIIDETLKLQYLLEIGDSLKIGSINFAIVGIITKIPGESVAFSSAAPRIMFSQKYLEATKLVQPGSMINYNSYIKLPDGQNGEAIEALYENDFKRLELRVRTVEEQEERIARSLTNLYRFLNLIGFISLILGSIGVASAVHVYIKGKINTISVLHCLGATSKQTTAIYLIQAGSMGFIGSLTGALLGLGIQFMIPIVLADIVPVDLTVEISYSALFAGLGIGLGISLLFALLPLTAIRNISPLIAIRAFLAESISKKKDYLKWAIYAIIVIAVFLFAAQQTRRIEVAFGFLFFLMLSFAGLYFTARLVIFLVKTLFPRNVSFILRQSLSNLFRPNNQTIIMIVSIGLGTMLIATMQFVQHSLYEQISIGGSGDNPNLVMFDIQSDQREGVHEIIEKNGLELLQDVAMIDMKIHSFKGILADTLLKDTTEDRSRWVFRRTFRSTYRDHLIDTETILEGEFIGKVDSDIDTIPISVNNQVLDGLNAKIGDYLQMNIQGLIFDCKIASVRKVDWRRVQPNFMILFPAGVLEEAPQIHVAVSRSDDAQKSADVQRDIVFKYPNISTIDISSVITTIEKIIDKIAFIIRFMALFSILTGITVLIGAMISSRYQRIQENILLRTLGAKKQHIYLIMFNEYLLLATLASMTGIFLAYGSSYLLNEYLFKMPFIPDFNAILVLYAAIVTLIISLGLINNRGVVKHSPLEILRRES